MEDIKKLSGKIIPKENFKEITHNIYSLKGGVTVVGLVTGNVIRDTQELINLMNITLGYRGHQNEEKVYRQP